MATAQARVGGEDGSRPTLPAGLSTALAEFSRVLDGLWPWLQEHRYTDSRDVQPLRDFLDRLGRRDAHLRPSIGLQRTWGWTEVADLKEQHRLIGEIRGAISDVLSMLDEPLPPGCRLPDSSPTIPAASRRREDAQAVR